MPDEEKPADGTRSETGLLTVSRTYKEGKVVTHEEAAEELIQVRPFVAEPARVRFGARMTLNLGNYQSAQTIVEVELPGHVEELAETFNAAKKFVDARLGEEVPAIREYKKTLGK